VKLSISLDMSAWLTFEEIAVALAPARVKGQNAPMHPFFVRGACCLPQAEGERLTPHPDALASGVSPWLHSASHPAREKSGSDWNGAS